MNIRAKKVSKSFFVWKKIRFQKIELINFKVPKNLCFYIFNSKARNSEYLRPVGYISPIEAKKWGFPFGQIIYLMKEEIDKSEDWLGTILHEIGHHLAWKFNIIPDDLGEEEQQADDLGSQWFFETTNKKIRMRIRKNTMLARGKLIIEN